MRMESVSLKRKCHEPEGDEVEEMDVVKSVSVPEFPPLKKERTQVSGVTRWMDPLMP